MSRPTVYLVTGAARGLGVKFVEELSARPNSIVFAGVRNVGLSPDEDLAKLVAKSPEVIFPVQLRAGNVADSQAAAKIVKDKVGKVDVLIANAGKSTGITPLLTVSAADLNSDFEVNAIGPIVLYQAFASLLLASDAPGGAKYVIVSSLLGQIKDSMPYDYNAYGISKAAANFFAKKVDQMNPSIVGFPISPGVVDTDMGRAGAAELGMNLADFGALSPLVSVQGMLSVIDTSTKDFHGGRFWAHNGEELSY